MLQCLRRELRLRLSLSRDRAVVAGKLLSNSFSVSTRSVPVAGKAAGNQTADSERSRRVRFQNDGRSGSRWTGAGTAVILSFTTEAMEWRDRVQRC